jgi:hypothetical protein
VIRLFRDHRGARWEVVLGRESWGVQVALFVSRDEDAVRQTVLEAASQEEASRHLADLDEEGIDDLFQRSEPRVPDGEPGMGREGNHEHG